ncbi:DUF4132 domain-containing protein [Flammeovirga yaeyamensis]|uniref:DUF4132 domain-containing protein n=1 Tax=Flammeovirga yaeyamensis TaxID=367791 RepID=A0AAX1MYU0_9BACT|nr:DUF4132 domain-containing protein [Flammeovirga yaeyamensis]MBB3696026.1 hypothetical protein [Flammeovirga yaeyamensis]NMF34712.1 DUF4132 domain-containing protein [Flammeovirga yaeyamensis]QWG00459.1 DUF4132 domain-containing protein [Flammeovirga yaeyamensis]
MFGLFKKKKEVLSFDIKAFKYLKEIVSQNQSVYGYQDLQQLDVFQNIKKLSDNEKKELIHQFLDIIEEIRKTSTKKNLIQNGYLNFNENYHKYSNLANEMISALLKSKMNYDDKEWINLMNRFKNIDQSLKQYSAYYYSFNNFPINYTIKQIEYYLKDHPVSEELSAYLIDMLNWKQFKTTDDRYYYGSNLNTAKKKIQKILNINQDTNKFELSSNDIGPQVNEIIQSISSKNEDYYELFHLISDVNGGKPTQKLIKKVMELQDNIGVDQYKKVAHQLLKLPLTYDFVTKEKRYNWRDNVHTYTETTFLCKPSQNFIKGMVWSMHRYSDKETIHLLSKLCEKSYSKIPGVGPAAASVGNATAYILGNMRGKDGLGALSRLKLKVKQNNIKKTIDKYLNEGAKKFGISVEELKEMSVPDFKLNQGRKRILLGDHTLEISIEGNNVIQVFFNKDGRSLKSVPSAVKNSPSLYNKLKEARKEIKEIKTVVSSQKQRIDNQFILDRNWDYTSFKKYYIEHGVLYPIVSKLIWIFTKNERSVDAIYKDSQWYTVNDEVVDWIDNNTTVKLWHPVHVEEDNILQWRTKMIDLEWKQPIKQAFRELYLLTDAELSTKSYSNRMAAHIIKQHQFNALSSLRDWKYSLMGAFDDGIDADMASKYLPEYGLTAQFFIDEIVSDDDFNDTGIWLHVATDQVKFINKDNQTVDLADVPKVVFSEIMRDVDMFVGVCSVGNDPQWMDNNGDRQIHRGYWQSYSFGDLNEIAKTKKSILENLLPRLTKLKGKAEINGKFLIVKGDLRTYKIHIGSGNILMEPNDQYLCIVPARSAETKAEKVFVPFEGDRGLSIVLSKAFLLVDDKKITDSTITSQINRQL